MARNRMLNPDFWIDEEISKLSPHARLLYMGLWGICDDNYATLPNRPDWIKVQIFPYENLDIKNLLKELQEIGKIIIFTFENKEYWWIKNFFKHQRVEKPSRAKYPNYTPTPRLLPDYSATPPRKVSKLSKEVSVSSTKYKREFVPVDWQDKYNKEKHTTGIGKNKVQTIKAKDGKLYCLPEGIKGRYILRENYLKLIK